MSHATPEHPWEDQDDPRNGRQWLTGKPCVEPRCGNPAGTAWSPLWCQPCNAERLNRIVAQLDDAMRRMKRARGVTP